MGQLKREGFARVKVYEKWTSVILYQVPKGWNKGVFRDEKLGLTAFSPKIKSKTRDIVKLEKCRSFKNRIPIWDAV